MTNASRFSIVTPTYNSERYLSETIDSVISQAGNFSIEFFIMDGGSTDGTQEIVQRYQKLLLENMYPVQCEKVVVHWHSEKDGGMYDAINKGFAQATGDIYAWINSDDIYLSGTFTIIQQTLQIYPEISWLKGITSYINENSTIYAVGNCNLYYQDLIKAGLYGPVLYFIQQDSVFWREDLWKKSGGVDASLTLAGDYFLWRSFSELAPLYSLNAYVSCFRKVPKQKSADLKAYFREIEHYSPLDKHLSNKVRRFFGHVESLPEFLHPICYRLAFGQHKYHLVMLKSGVVPYLVEGEYFALKNMI